MMEKKIGISFATQTILGLLGSITLAIMLPYQMGVAEWLLITVLGLVQILIMPIILLFNLDFTFESSEAASIMALAILSVTSFVWWIILMAKSKRNWLVAVPITVWIVIGIIATYVARTSI